MKVVILALCFASSHHSAQQPLECRIVGWAQLIEWINFYSKRFGDFQTKQRIYMIYSCTNSNIKWVNLQSKFKIHSKTINHLLRIFCTVSLDCWTYSFENQFFLFCGAPRKIFYLKNQTWGKKWKKWKKTDFLKKTWVLGFVKKCNNLTKNPVSITIKL